MGNAAVRRKAGLNGRNGPKASVASLSGLVDKIARPAAQHDKLWESGARPVGSDLAASPLGCPPTQLKRSRSRQKCKPLVSLTSLSPSFPQNVNSFPHIDNRLSNNSNATSQPISCLRCGRHVQVHIGNLGPRYRNDIRILTPRSQISAIARRLL